MRSKRYREKSVERPLVTGAYERLQGLPGLTVCCDVPLLGRCVDMAYIREGMLTTVEFKVRDWRRAILQARDHQLAADYCYICMPRRNVSDALRAQLASTGIGLTFYREKGTWPFELIVEAERSHDTWDAARSQTWTYVESILHAER